MTRKQPLHTLGTRALPMFLVTLAACSDVDPTAVDAPAQVQAATAEFRAFPAWRDTDGDADATSPMLNCLNERVPVTGVGGLGTLTITTAEGLVISLPKPLGFDMNFTGARTDADWIITRYTGPFISAKDHGPSSAFITETAHFTGNDGSILVRAGTLVRWDADGRAQVVSRSLKCHHEAAR